MLQKLITSVNRPKISVLPKKEKSYYKEALSGLPQWTIEVTGAHVSAIRAHEPIKCLLSTIRWVHGPLNSILLQIFVFYYSVPK